MPQPSPGDLVLARRIAKGGIREVHFKVADRCNHVCGHCYQVQGEKGELDTAQALEAVDRIAASGAFLLTLSGGEATLRSDLFVLIERARSHGMAVTLFTNAYNVDEAYARRLAELAVWRVQVSLYGPDASTHERVTRVPGSFERTLAGVRALRAASVPVVLKTPVMGANRARLDALRELALSLGCSFASTNEITVREDGSAETLAMAPTRDEHVAHYRTEEPGDFSPEARAQARLGSTCRVGHGTLVVEANGEVRPCTSLTVPLGNALRDDLRDVLEGERNAFLRSLRVEHLHGCRDCDLLPGCKRCHGNAALEAGDALGPYPSACERAIARYEASIGARVGVLSDEPRDRGPYRIERHGVLRAMPDVKTDADEALARRHPWLRPDPQHVAERLRAPQGLVQLRRGPHGASKRSVLD